ncbi:MAG TPA: CPBP family intramembrane metalloprotease [Candidatus Marinimicrobia bacterium]|nr:CPBP family intramembrane metalloprotease [Candidatus Neomarinimicrobiota bacterium]
MLRFDSVLSAFFLLSTISILAPLGEELLFRGFLQKILEESWKDITKAVLITSIFFAFIHMNPYWIIQIYLMGILLGYLAWRTGSIIPSFILHGLNNTFALFLNNATPSIEHIYSWNGHVTPLLLAIAVGLIIFGFKRLNTHLEILS